MSEVDLGARANGLFALLSEHAEQSEAERRVPTRVVANLAEAGFFRMLVPRHIGGLEVTPREMIRAIRGVARGDAAAGWCVMVGATTGLLAAYVDEATAREIYGDPKTVTSGVFAPTAMGVREAGGYRITGRWAFSSGVDHARFRMGGFVVPASGDAKAEIRHAIFRAEDTTVHDTWHVMGLEGTGSHDMSVDGAYVPEAQAVRLVGAKPVVDRALYKFSIYGLLSMGVAAVAVGIAERAVEDLVTLASDKRALGASRTMAEREVVQADVGRARGLVGAASAFLETAAAEAYEKVLRGEELLLVDRARLREAATFATHASAEATTLMYKAGGGSALYRKSPLQRHFRNVHVATQHVMVHEHTYVTAGRAAFGLPVEGSSL